MTGFISRGFGGRRRVDPELAARIPPGQYLERDFPVLTAGPTPRIGPDDWSITIDGIVAQPQGWTAAEFRELPHEDVPCDIHCVTKWSKLDTSFGGVSVDTLLEGTDPKGGYVMAYSYGGYTTHPPPARVTHGQAGGGTPPQGEPPPPADRRPP